MKMMKIRNMILLSSLMVAGLTSCSIDEAQINYVDQSDKVSDVAADALPGQLIVKFDESVSRILEEAGVTKSGIGAPAMRSGVLSVDEILDLVEGYEIERIFPVDSRTEETARQDRKSVV